MCGLFEKDLIFGTCRKKLLSTNYLKFMELLIRDGSDTVLTRDMKIRRGHDLMIITT